MEIPAGAIVNGVEVFLLVFVRMTGLFVVAPIFGRRNIPTSLKVGFSLLLALIVVNAIKFETPGYSGNVYQLGFLIAQEFIVGITIGYISYLVFTAIYIAGQLIDMQVGFGMVNVIDPVSNIQVPITSNFYFITCMLIFLTVNGHHALISALFDSYRLVPLGGAVFNTDLMNDIIRVFASTFFIGIKISAPVVAAILITEAALGVISKSIPQLNVFVVGMPLKIFLGILVIWITMPMFISIIDALIYGMNNEMHQFMKDLGQSP